MLPKKKLSSIVFICSLNTLCAQDGGFLPGYIITNSSDTIRGLVKYINQVPYRILSDIKFKENENAKTQQYSPAELIGYSSEARVFTSVATSSKANSKRFMELVTDGYVKTYRLTTSSFGSGREGINTRSGDYLLKSGDSTAFKIDFDNWNEKLSDYLADNKPLSIQVRNGVFKWKEFADIIKAYNASH